jgi:hypothetical protein
MMMGGVTTMVGSTGGGSRMTRKRRAGAALALALVLHAVMLIAPDAKAEDGTLGADLSAGAISVIATVIGAPLRAVACVATVGLGGTLYGLTLGTSELVRQELVAGTNATCGGKYYVTPEQIKRLSGESERAR